jgi:hypothetical protein
LFEQVDDTVLRLRAVDLDDLLERCPFEKLHGVIEDSIRGASVIEHGHGVGVREHRGASHFTLKSNQSLFAGAIGKEEFDGGGPTKHRVRGAVDDPHAPLAELLFERVLTEPTDVPHLFAETVDRVRKRCRHGHRHSP